MAEENLFGRQQADREALDEAVQLLYAVTLQLGARMRTLPESSLLAREALHQASTQINDIIQQLRRFIVELSD